jgi:tetratricopeptide (TPR) repeat protein
MVMVLLLGLILWPHPELRPASEAQSLLAQGNAWLQGNHLIQAEEAYRRALAADSLQRNAHLNLGLIAHERGQWTTAVREYGEELRLHPDNLQAYVNLGALFHQLQHYDRARSIYELGLKRNPLHSDLRYNLSLTLKKLAAMQEEAGHPDSAARFREEAERLRKEP